MKVHKYRNNSDKKIKQEEGQNIRILKNNENKKMIGNYQFIDDFLEMPV